MSIPKELIQFRVNQASQSTEEWMEYTGKKEKAEEAENGVSSQLSVVTEQEK